MSMSSREIILANINHQSPERPGMAFGAGKQNDFLSVGCGWPGGKQQRRWTEGNLEYYDDIWGNIWVRMKDGCEKGEIHQPAISEWSQLDQLELPLHDVDDLAASFSKRFEDNPQDRFKLAAIGGWIFDNARYLRKMEVYFLDMAMYPDELKRMHAMICEVYERRILAAGKSGADGIMIGEDMGTQKGLLFSPHMFREYFKEDYARLMGIAHDYGMKVLLHSCGQNWAIIDDLCDCGVDVFQFDQPAVYDMPTLAVKFRQRGVALWSPVDIQKVLPTGDRAFIESETRRMCELFDGFLLTKCYPDLPGIGVDEEWNDWFYNTVCDYANRPDLKVSLSAPVPC